MAHKDGTKSGGRKKGVPNKRTQDLLQICEEEGVEPFRSMIRAAKEVIDPKEQTDSWEKVCQYLHPKRKAIEHSGGLDISVQQELEGLMKLSEAELLELIKREAK